MRPNDEVEEITDAQAFALLAWLVVQKDITPLVIGAERYKAACAVKGKYVGGKCKTPADLKQFLLDCVAAVMAARRQRSPPVGPNHHGHHVVIGQLERDSSRFGCRLAAPE